MTDLSIRVAASNDDGHASATTLYRGDYYSFIGNFSGTAYRNFFRFLNVTIPQGATIISAIIRFECGYDNGPNTVCSQRIRLEDSDNAAQIGSTLADLTGRALTSGYVDWTVPAWTNGVKYDTEDFTDVLQAVVNRAGWASGNALQVHLLDNGSSSNAYRYAQNYDSFASRAAELIISYDDSTYAEVDDVSGLGDAVDSFSLTDGIFDAAGITDEVEGYDFSGITPADGVGIIDAVDAVAEFEGVSADAAGLGDAVDSGGTELAAAAADGAGIADTSDGFNWSAWLRTNIDQAVKRFYLTITGGGDGTTDIEIPMSSFQARKRSGDPTYLSVVVPFSVATVDALEARANGEMVIEMAYLLDGVESVREEILRADLEQINPQEGPGSRSITLIGHKTITYANQETQLSDPIYKYTSDGRLGYRFATPDPYINPGDTAIVGEDEFTVESVVYMVSVGSGQTVMEVQE